MGVSGQDGWSVWSGRLKCQVRKVGVSGYEGGPTSG
jgi:hypothetical protein